jgi:hypothetical protein
MQLLDLPLDCFRLLMGFAAEEIGIRDLLRLRLVSRAMNTEVMHAIETARLFLQTQPTAGSPNYPSCHPRFRKKLPITSCYVDFITSFVFVRPHLQDPWNANISSFLNSVVDELLCEDDLDVNHPSRKELLRRLCHHLFEMKHWKQQTQWFAEALNCSTDFSLGTQTIGFNVMLANVLLGRHTLPLDLDGAALVQKKSSVFGTLLDVSVKSGRVNLVNYLIERGVMLGNDVHSVIEMAAECPNDDMLRTIFTPIYGFRCSAAKMTECIMQAIENDRTEAALYLLRKTNDPVFAAPDALVALQEACNRGNLAVVEAMIDELGIINFQECEIHYKNRLIQYAAFYGHKHILQYFFEKGVNRDPCTLRAAAISGDIPMARFLHEQGVRLRGPQSWASMLRIATNHASPRHFAWTCAMIEEFVPPSLLLHSDVQLTDLIQYACIHGNLDMIRLLVKAGMDINDVPGLDIPPVILALAVSRPDVAAALIAMGADAIDPLESTHSDQFKSGSLPKRTEELKEPPFRARRVCERGVLSDWDDFD